MGHGAFRQTTDDLLPKFAKKCGELEAKLIAALCKKLDLKGTLHVMRHGFKFYGKVYGGEQAETEMLFLGHGNTLKP